MLSNEDIFKVLETDGKKLSDWLKENFNPHTAIIITDTEIKIVQTLSSVPNPIN